jgi:hypothetical protein
MPEDLELGLPTECTTIYEVINHLVFLITKGTRPIVGQTMPVQPIQSPTLVVEHCPIIEHAFVWGSSAPKLP